MEINKAEAFLAVADELHFGRAARRLHMAQPPLSRLIRQLEAELGAELFERTTRQVTMTPQGEALLEPARELVMLSRRMKEIVQRSRSGETGRIRLGFAGPSVNQLVGALARRVRLERPGVSLELHSSQFSYRGLENVVDGTLDLVIGRWDFLPAEIGSRVISTEQLLIALPDHHRLAGRSAVAPADLAEDPWIVLPGRSAATLPNRLHMIAAAGGFAPRIVQVAPDSSTLLLLVAAGMGVSLTFSGVRDNVPASGVVYKPLATDQDAVEVRLVWRHANRNPALPAVVSIAERIFPGASPSAAGDAGAEA